MAKRNKKPKYSAKEEFRTSSYMKGDLIEENRKKLRNAKLKITKIERVEFDDGERAWRMHTNGFDLPFNLNNTNGSFLGEHFGDDPFSWEGETVIVNATKTTKGWGITVDVEDGDESDEDEEDDKLPFEEDDDDDVE